MPGWVSFFEIVKFFVCNSFLTIQNNYTMKLSGLISGLVLSLCFVTASLSAQDLTTSNTVDSQVKEMVKKFQDAYNQKDWARLKKLFHSQIERTSPDGTVTSGADAVANSYAEQQKTGSWTLTLRDETIVRQEDGTVVVTGSYKSVNSTGAVGETKSGTFAIDLVKGDRQMMIKKIRAYAAL